MAERVQVIKKQMGAVSGILKGTSVNNQIDEDDSALSAVDQQNE